MKNYFLTMIVAGLTALMFSSCATNPVTGKRQLMLLSTDQEAQMGAESDPQIVASYGLYKDQDMQQFINSKGKLMGRISHRPDINYEFKILDSPVVNAFALPGGYIYFTRGIMAHFNNEAQFAGVLGHEIGHVTARHSAQRYSRQLLAQVGLVAGMVVSPEFGQFADVAAQGLGLLFLKYGRDDETESDRLGVEYSTKIGYDAVEMAGFFRTLERLTDQAGGSLPTFMSTHPDPANRNQRVAELAKEWKQRANRSDYEVGREDYLRMIDGMVYGEDPRQGFVEGNTFYHPDLKFQFPVPSGWQTVNMPMQVQMAPQDGKALMLMRLSTQNTLAQADQAFRDQYPFDITGRQQTTVNGFPAIILRGQQVDEQSQQVTQMMAYLIEYGGRVYDIIGLAYQQDFNNYVNTFERTMQGFRTLNDASKLNVQPDRLRIAEVRSATNLRSFLQQEGVSGDRLEELAILNGMQLADQLNRGTLVKVIE